MMVRTFERRRTEKIARRHGTKDTSNPFLVVEHDAVCWTVVGVALGV